MNKIYVISFLVYLIIFKNVPIIAISDAQDELESTIGSQLNRFLIYYGIPGVAVVKRNRLRDRIITTYANNITINRFFKERCIQVILANGTIFKFNGSGERISSL